MRSKKGLPVDRRRQRWSTLSYPRAYLSPTGKVKEAVSLSLSLKSLLDCRTKSLSLSKRLKTPTILRRRRGFERRLALKRRAWTSDWGKMSRITSTLMSFLASCLRKSTFSTASKAHSSSTSTTPMVLKNSKRLVNFDLFTRHFCCYLPIHSLLDMLNVFKCTSLFAYSLLNFPLPFAFISAF